MDIGVENLKISQMDINDLNSICDILVSQFDDFWSYDIFKSELESTNSKYIVAKIDNMIVGFAGIKIICDCADIMNIVVKKAYRNKGIGTLLLKNIIDLCRKSNLTSISLEVNEDNLIAISLYENLGFQSIGKRKKYYNRNDGIIMINYLH